MKILLDQGLPRGAVAELRRLGFDAVHTGDIGLAAATDEDIVRQARRDAQTIVTLDADFHALLALSSSASPSVIRVRIEGLRAQQLAVLVQRVVALCEADLRAGCMVTVDEHSVRVRALPVVRQRGE